MSIYVEREIDVPLESLWKLTQDPAQHQRWDLRFTQIHYLPRLHPDDPQEFLYETRIGFGLAIRGTGATRGHHAADGARTSSLLFASPNPLSLIRKGRGYWRYQPTPTGVRFITSYDYAVRWGLPGRILDRALFRPLMAWATAWSFDRLALWLTAGIPPERSLRTSAASALARISLSAVWLYEGIVPKLLGPHPDELSMSLHAGFSPLAATRIAFYTGWLEVIFGLLLLALWRKRWPAALSLSVMFPALAVAALSGWQFIAAPFNVVIVNTMVAALSLVVLLLQPETVSAANCRWTPFRRQSSSS